MKFVCNFSEFLFEWSKNDPIPEISKKKDKLGIILLGTPGIGKSTFIGEFIHPRNFNIKVFSTDDVSLTFTKDPNVYYEPSSELNLKRLFSFIESGQSFIYDTTGTQQQNIINVLNISKQFGYTTIFIHLSGSIEMSRIGNLSRQRQVPDDYLIRSYQKQKSSQEVYSKMNHDGYYIVERTEYGYNISKMN